MRKALITITSSILFLFLVTGISFSKDEKHSFSALKYNYIVESELSLSEFSQAFYERLKTAHKWNALSSDNCQGESCVSVWKFTDDNANEWKCEVVIKKDELNDHKMLVTMEMNPVLGS